MFVYDPITQFVVLDSSNPNNVVTADVGTYFYRKCDNFLLVLPFSEELIPISVSKKALAYPYYNEAWFKTIPDFRITYAHQQEIWFKANGSSSSGWQFICFDQSIGTKNINIDYLLLEDGTNMLLEDGEFILIEY
jgi:hypothetical protein